MHAARLGVLLLAAGFVVLAADHPLALRQESSSASPSSSTEKPRVSRDLQLGDKAVWTDTDLELQPGERAVFTATGTGRCPGQTSEFGPNGLARGYRDLLRILPVNQAGRGALIGRIGDNLRVWKAPFQVEGSTLWVGAATHDIGFERDRRNNGVTHKIDPDVDLERDYVEKTLTATGLVSEFTHVPPAKPPRDAKTATGGTFHSDGEVLVLKADDTAAAPATVPVSSFK